MPFNKKWVFFLSLFFFVSFFATHDCFAKTVEWKDFTRTLKLDKFKLTSNNPLTINVYIPAAVLKKFKKIPLVFNGSGSGWQTTLTINDSFWAVHHLPERMPPNFTFNLKTKHLKAGINKLSFTKKHHGHLFFGSLQLNLGKAEKGRTKKIETQSTAKTSKSTQQIPQPSEPSTDTIAEKDKFKIAVMEFKSLNPGAKTTNLGSMISEMFTTEVVNNNSFKIVEREQLNKILGELKIGQSGVLDTTDAQKLGKILGARAIITGSVMKMGDNLRIDSRIIEVETGIIVSAERRICKEDLNDISRNIADMTAALAQKFYKKK
jgi:TolB-like protein